MSASVTRTMKCRKVGWLINDKLENELRESSFTGTEIISKHFSVGKEENHE